MILLAGFLSTKKQIKEEIEKLMGCWNSLRWSGYWGIYGCLDAKLRNMKNTEWVPDTITFKYLTISPDK